MPTRLWLPVCRGLGFGWAALASFHRQAPLTGFTPPPSKDADQLLLRPIFQQTCPERTKFSGHSFCGSAFGCSSFLTFVSPRSLPLRSAPPVNPACAALRGAYPQNRAVLASAPSGSAPLQKLTAPPCAYPLATYETNVFYWPAKAQFQPREAHPNVRLRAPRSFTRESVSGSDGRKLSTG